MDTLDNIYVKGMSVPSYRGVGAPTSVSQRSCPSMEDGATGASLSVDIQIKFDQVLGLWAIQAGTVGMALICTAVVLLVFKCRPQATASQCVAPAQGEESNGAKEPGGMVDHHGMLLVDGISAGSAAGSPKPHASCEVSLCELDQVTSFSNQNRKLGSVPSPLSKQTKQRQQHFAVNESFSASPLRLQPPQHDLRKEASLSPTSGRISQQKSAVQSLNSSPDEVVTNLPGEAEVTMPALVSDDEHVLPVVGRAVHRSELHQSGAATGMSADVQETAVCDVDDVVTL